MSQILCPNCNLPNPEGAESCLFCGSSLKPAEKAPDAPIRPGQQPTVKPTSELDKVKTPPITAGQTPVPRNTDELEQALPAWLRSLREQGELTGETGSTEEAVSSGGQPSASPSAQESEEPLDWLNRLSQEEEEIPDWIASLGGAETPAASGTSQPAKSAGPFEMPEMADSQAASSQPAEEEALPDWLGAFAQSPESSEDKSAGLVSQDETASADILPDWLDRLTPQAQETPAPSEETETPDWLSGLSLGEEQAAPQAAPEPDWLFNQAAEPAEEKPESSSPAFTETPDWLAALEASAASESASEEQSVFREDLPVENAAPLEIPDWLTDFRVEEPKASAPAQAGEELAESLPDWLSGVQPTPSSSAGSVPALIGFEETSELTEQPAQEKADAFLLETPDWLERLGPEQTPEPVSPPAAESQGDESLQMAELPSWVQAMRPVESVISETGATVSESEGVVEQRGPLAGIRGVLPFLEIVPGRKPPAYSIKLQVTEQQQKYARLLEKLIQDEGQPKHIKPSVQYSIRIWRWIISVLLIVSALLPLVLGGFLSPDLTLFPSEWEQTHVLLDSFPENAAVLIVFDYGPAFFSELQVAAAPVVDRLLYRGARLALISTSPSGPALANQFLNSTQASHLQVGAQIVNLGYLPGGSSGVYYFASAPREAAPVAVDGSNPWESAVLSDVYQLSDFDALVVITENADTARAWVEQTQSHLGDTPVFLIVSAQAEPMVRPYYDSGQVDGLVTGLVGGKTYEQTFGTSGLARLYWDSLGMGVLAALLLILVGGAQMAILALREKKGGNA